MKRKVQLQVNGLLRVNIPREISTDLDMLPGSKVDFSIVDGKIIMTPIRTPEKISVSVPASDPAKGGEAWQNIPNPR